MAINSYSSESVLHEDIATPVYQKALNENQEFWLEKIHHSQSQEELEIWHEKAQETATLLMEKARALSVSEKAEPLALVLCEASRDLINQSEEESNKRKKEVPEATNVKKNALWPMGGLGLTALGVLSFFGAPVGIPVKEILLGVTTWGYAAWEFMRRGQKLENDVKSHQSKEVQAESGMRLGGASVSIALGVMGLVEVAGVFPPIAALVIAACAIIPVAIDSAFRFKEYFDTKKAITAANTQGNEQIEKLSTAVEHFNIDEIRPVPHHNSSIGADIDRLYSNFQKKEHAPHKSSEFLPVSSIAETHPEFSTTEENLHSEEDNVGEIHP